MPSVVHLVTTSNFAGVERYVCDVAIETAERGWEAAVVGGDAMRMPAALSSLVRWLPGATPSQALRSVARLGQRDIYHAHMTTAEGIAVAARRLHKAPIVSTRHFAAHRGSSLGGHLAAPWLSRALTRQIAVSEFVARNIEQPPDVVIENGVRPSPCLWQSSSRVVLVMQRLEREKDTTTALRAWSASRLEREGWSLRVVGAGSERVALEAWTSSAGVSSIEFVGWAERVADQFASAGILLAPGPADSFGLVVVEAMAAGVPVVASAAGGHLETVGLLPNAAMFAPGDADAAGAALRSLSQEGERGAVSRAGRQLVQERFTLARHVDALLAEYAVSLRLAGRSTAVSADLATR